MATSISQGKARLFAIVVSVSNGGMDTTTALSAVTNQPDVLKVAVNPANSREVGVLALAPTTGADVHIARASDGAFDQVFTVTVPTTEVTGITVGEPGAEVEPPSWLASA